MLSDPQAWASLLTPTALQVCRASTTWWRSRRWSASYNAAA